MLFILDIYSALHIIHKVRTYLMIHMIQMGSVIINNIIIINGFIYKLWILWTFILNINREKGNLNYLWTITDTSNLILKSVAKGNWGQCSNSEVQRLTKWLSTKSFIIQVQYNQFNVSKVDDGSPVIWWWS